MWAGSHSLSRRRYCDDVTAPGDARLSGSLHPRLLPWGVSVLHQRTQCGSAFKAFSLLRRRWVSLLVPTPAPPRTFRHKSFPSLCPSIFLVLSHQPLLFHYFFITSIWLMPWLFPLQHSLGFLHPYTQDPDLSQWSFRWVILQSHKSPHTCSRKSSSSISLSLINDARGKLSHD